MVFFVMHNFVSGTNFDIVSPNPIFIGASTLPMTTPTAYVIPLRTSHTRCVPKNFKQGEFSLSVHIEPLVLWHPWIQLAHKLCSHTEERSVSAVICLSSSNLLFVSLPGDPLIIGCVTPWTCTARSSGNMAASILPTPSSLRGRLSSWWRRELSGEDNTSVCCCVAYTLQP